MQTIFHRACARTSRKAVSAAVFILLAAAGGTARADGYMAYSDFSSCPRNQIAETRREAGPFPSLADCQAYLSSVRQYNVCERRGCRPVGSSSASDAGGSGNGLIDKSSEAIAKGIVYGDAPTVGVGLMGLLGAALIQGAQSDPAAAERRAREAAIAAEQKRLAEEERLRQQELAKQRILGSLKGAESTASLTLKMGDSDAPLTESYGPSGGTPLSNRLHLKLGDAAESGMQAGQGFDTAGKIMGSELPPSPPAPVAKPVLSRQEVLNDLRVKLKKNDADEKALKNQLTQLQQAPKPDAAAISQVQDKITAAEKEKEKIKKQLDLTASDDANDPGTAQPPKNPPAKSDQ